MEVVPATVGRASRAWDEQHLDLTAAAGQIGDAATDGFTSGVSGAASRFAATWRRHAEGAAADAEARADGLRTTIADFLATDDAAGYAVLALQGYLVEVR